MINYRPVKLVVILCCWATEDINWTESKHCIIIAQYPQESIQFTLSGHPMFGETAIISCFFKICLCIIMIIQYKVRGGQPQRPVNFITRSHWDSNSKMGNHHRGKTRNAYQATVLDSLGGYHHRGKTRSACQATALDIPMLAHAMQVKHGAHIPLSPG